MKGAKARVLAPNILSVWWRDSVNTNKNFEPSKYCRKFSDIVPTLPATVSQARTQAQTGQDYERNRPFSPYLGPVSPNFRHAVLQ